MLRPTNEQFIAILNAPDLAVLSIRGHVAIESALSDVIQQALPDPHHLEVKRLSFPLKVDLAVALKSLHKDSRPLFIKLNTIRNSFAHQATADLDEALAGDLKNSMSELHRKIVGDHFDTAKEPRLILRVATAAAFYEACMADEHLVHKKLEKDAWREEVKVLLKETEHYSNHPATGKFAERVQARLEAKKKSLSQNEDKPS
jgi:hypothetical protein